MESNERLPEFGHYCGLPELNIRIGVPIALLLCQIDFDAGSEGVYLVGSVVSNHHNIGSDLDVVIFSDRKKPGNIFFWDQACRWVDVEIRTWDWLAQTLTSTCEAANLCGSSSFRGYNLDLLTWLTKLSYGVRLNLLAPEIEDVTPGLRMSVSRISAEVYRQSAVGRWVDTIGASRSGYSGLAEVMALEALQHSIMAFCARAELPCTSPKWAWVWLAGLPDSHKWLYEKLKKSWPYTEHFNTDSIDLAKIVADIVWNVEFWLKNGDAVAPTIANRTEEERLTFDPNGDIVRVDVEGRVRKAITLLSHELQRFTQ